MALAMNEADSFRFMRIEDALEKIKAPGEDAIDEVYAAYGKRAKKVLECLSKVLIAMSIEHYEDFEDLTGEKDAEPFLAKLEFVCSENERRRQGEPKQDNKAI